MLMAILQLAAMTAALVDLSHHAQYFHWSFILVSLPNLTVIGAMFVVFIAALLLPMPHRRRKGEGAE